ncbi:MAG: hypothetical protein AAFN41_12955, partial [Planctomycetota bacterium]
MPRHTPATLFLLGLPLSACASVPAASPAWDALPFVELVHSELGLFDVSLPEASQPLRIEVRNEDGAVRSIAADGVGESLRVQLSSADRLRLIDADGESGPWLAAHDIAQTNPAAEQTPGWALGAVWYNVFPERFDNGNPDNDQGWPHGTDLEWTQHWFEVTADEFEASANRAI